MPFEIDRAPYDTHDHRMAEGAVEDVVDEQILDDEEAVVDLTGASVRFRMRQTDDTSLVVDSSATVVDESNGEVEYQWSDGDTDTAGHYLAEFAVDESGDTGSNFEADRYYPPDGYLSIKIRETL